MKKAATKRITHGWRRMLLLAENIPRGRLIFVEVCPSMIFLPAKDHFFNNEFQVIANGICSLMKMIQNY